MKSKSKKRQTRLHTEAKRARKEGKVVGFIHGGGVIFATVGEVARRRMVTAAKLAEALGITKGAASVRLWRAAMAGRLVVTEKDGRKTYAVASKAPKSPQPRRKRKAAITGATEPEQPTRADAAPARRAISPADMGITPMGAMQ